MLNDDVLGPILLCMDDKHGLPIFDPTNPDLPEIVKRFLTPDQRKGFMSFSSEVLELAALAEMVLQYRYPDGISAFMEELFWRIEGHLPTNALMNSTQIRHTIREWLMEEIDNSPQLQLGF